MQDKLLKSLNVKNRRKSKEIESSESGLGLVYCERMFFCKRLEGEFISWTKVLDASSWGGNE